MLQEPDCYSKDWVGNNTKDTSMIYANVATQEKENRYCKLKYEQNSGLGFKGLENLFICAQK